MESEDEEWRWADVDGVQHLVDEWELVASLGDGDLPEFTLVWRTGWTEWHHANAVEELSTALPDDAEKTETTTPDVDESVREPPDPPLDKYQPYLTRDSAKKLASATPEPKSAPASPEDENEGALEVEPEPEPSTPSDEDKRRGAALAAMLAGSGASKAPPPPPPEPEPVMELEPEPEPEPEPVMEVEPELEPEGPPAPVAAAPRASDVAKAAGLIAGAGAAGVAKPAPPPDARIQEPPAPPSIPDRPPMPTLMEPEDHPGGGSTLRPPAAVPPPPRAVPSPPPGTAAPASVPQPPSARAPAAAIGPADVTPLPSFDSGAPPLAGGPSSRTAPPAVPPPPSPIAAATSFPTTLVALGGAIGLLLIAVVVVVLVRRTESDTTLPTTASTATTTTNPTDEPLVRACEIAHDAKRLDDAAYIRVPPEIARVPGKDRLAIGFASDAGTAVGITVDPATLDVDRPYHQRGGPPIVSVVPADRDGNLRFLVERTAKGLADARALPAARARVGLSSDGFARVTGDEKPTTIWPMDTRSITTPRVADVEGVGYAVTFRSGGQSGDVLVGWLTPEAKKKSGLAKLDDVPAFVGTPSVSAGPKNVLVTFAARDDESSYWGVVMGLGPHGKPPARTKRFVLPSGGPGFQAISPAASGLDSGGWVLQWTEGTGGDHVVRLVTLDRDLVPVGDAVSASPPGSNAGQGTVWVSGDRGLATFFVKVARGHELWGVGLKCP